MYGYENDWQKIENRNKKQEESEKTLKNEAFLNDCLRLALKELGIDIIDMENFRDIYGDGVDNDYAYIKLRERDFDDKNNEQEIRNKMIATILEAILCGQIYKNEILGSDINTTSTCKYDDYKNGVDTLLEIEEEVKISGSNKKIYHHAAIAIDATMSHRNINLYRKIKIIQDEIKMGKLTFIKYFQSKNSDHKGALLNIPKFVIGVDKNTIEGIAPLWYDGKNKTLSKHPFRVIVLKEILYQLDYFLEYAQLENQVKIVSKLKELKVYFEEVKKEDQDLITEIENNSDNQNIFDNDGVYAFFRNMKKNMKEGEKEYQEERQM